MLGHCALVGDVWKKTVSLRFPLFAKGGLIQRGFIPNLTPESYALIFYGRCNEMSDAGIEVTWDANKAQSNIAKHGVTFAQAATVLLDPLAITVFDEAHSQTEERWFTLGMSSEGKLLAVSHTYQIAEPGNTRVRIISAREAARSEANEYNIKADQSDR